MCVGLLRHWQFVAQMLWNVSYYGEWQQQQQQPSPSGSQGFTKLSRVTASHATAV